MPRVTRQLLLRESLSVLIALDLVGLIATLVDQWPGLSPIQAWGIAAAFAPSVFMFSRTLSAAVMAMTASRNEIPDTGEQIPTTGQSSPTRPLSMPQESISP